MAIYGSDVVEFLEQVLYDLENWRNADVFTLFFRVFLIFSVCYVIFLVLRNIWRVWQRVWFRLRESLLRPLWRVITLYETRKSIEYWRYKRKKDKERAKYEAEQREKLAFETEQIERQTRALEGKNGINNI